MDNNRQQVKDFINGLSTSQFIEWMNKSFLDVYEHGFFCDIHKMDDNSYWTEYLKPLGCNIAWGVANGCEKYFFNKEDTYVQYNEVEGYFMTFDNKDDFFTKIVDIDYIIDDVISKGINITL